MSDPYVGEVRLFVGNYAPVDWLPCDGRLLQVSSYQLLFAVMGSVYGGNGTTNFNLPDLRGRLPIGMGQGTGQPNYPLAAAGGSTGVVLAEANLPAHTHTISASSSPATSPEPNPNLTFAAVASNLRFYVDSTQGTVTSTTNFNPSVVSVTGSGQPHDNIMPCMALTYIICTNGLYPVHQ